MYDGILLIDKPKGWTSHDVVAKVRNTLNKEIARLSHMDAVQGSNEQRAKRTNGYGERVAQATDTVMRHKSAGMAGFAGQQGQTLRKLRVGHTGTLDPMATGLLVLVVGNYTKRAGEFSKLDKVYEAKLKLGETSTTGDSEGDLSPYVPSSQKGQQSRSLPKTSGALRRQNLRSSGNVPNSTSSSGAQSFLALHPDTSGERQNITIPTKTEVKEAINAFLGEIEQVPPAYSAVKIDGKRAYKLAREGKEVKIEPRQVKIYEITDIKYDYPHLSFVAKVSSGTYIRSLAQDIGKNLSTGAYLTELKRTKVGDFNLEKAHPPTEVNLDKIIQI